MSDRYNGKETWEEWSKEWKLEDRYNFKTIEKKWQDIWDKEKAYKVEPDPDKEKFYALVEFPYPSAPDFMSGIRAHTPLWTLFPARKECRVLMSCILWVLTLLACRRKTMR